MGSEAQINSISGAHSRIGTCAWRPNSGLAIGVPWLCPGVFTSDTAIVSQMQAISIPFLVGMISCPPTLCLEGTLLAGRDFGFLSFSMTACFVGGTALQVVDLNTGLTQSWWNCTWRAFDPDNQEQPLWTIRKSSVGLCSRGPRLQIFLPSNTDREIPDYTIIIGDWRCKKCTIFFGEQKVAEAVRETSWKNVLGSKSVFHVLVQPGVDTAFIFSLIIIMDKLYIHTGPDGGAAA